MDLSLSVMSGGPTVAGSVLRSNQAYLELLSAKTTFQWGIAFHCEKFPRLHTCHQFREAWVESSDEAPTALKAVEAFFSEHNSTCSRWALAEAQSPEPIEPTLMAAGYEREDTLAMTLGSWPTIAAPEGIQAGIRVLPARPMRAAFHECWKQAATYLPNTEERDIVAQAANERLDDHRMDAFVAMVDKEPAGTCTLFQVGDIGRIVDLHVGHNFRRHGVGTALLNHVIALARRLAMRVVCAEVSSRNTNGTDLLRKSGFLEGGRIIEYHRQSLITDY